MTFLQFPGTRALWMSGSVLGLTATPAAGQYELYNTDGSAWLQRCACCAEFVAEPLGSFDFGSGPIEVGNANLILRDQGQTIDVVALSLRLGDVVVTLQSERGLNPTDVLWGPGTASQGARTYCEECEFWI